MTLLDALVLSTNYSIGCDLIGCTYIETIRHVSTEGRHWSHHQWNIGHVNSRALSCL